MVPHHTYMLHRTTVRPGIIQWNVFQDINSIYIQPYTAAAIIDALKPGTLRA